MNRNEKDFKIARKVLIASIILHHVTIFVLITTPAVDYLWFYTIFVILFLYLFMGISGLVSAILYWLSQFEGKEDNRERMIRCALCIAYVTICGLFANVSFWYAITYIVGNLNILDALWQYLLFYCIMIVVWTIGLICSIRYNEKIRTPGMAKRWVLVVCTIGVLLLSAFTYESKCYVEDKTDDIYWDMNLKHFEVYGEPLQRNPG